MSAKLIITNNQRVTEFYNNTDLDHYYQLLWVKGNTLAVLTQVRDICHTGGILLTHPLSGSIKPNQSPFKTIVLNRTDKVDIESVILAEDSLSKARDLTGSRPAPAIPEQSLGDLQAIDFDLFKSYLQTAVQIS